MDGCELGPSLSELFFSPCPFFIYLFIWLITVTTHKLDALTPPHLFPYETTLTVENTPFKTVVESCEFYTYQNLGH